METPNQSLAYRVWAVAAAAAAAEVAAVVGWREGLAG